MNGELDLSLFALGTGPEQGVVDEWTLSQGITEFPTRPEGPTAAWGETFGFGSPFVSQSVLPGEPETTVDWSQTIARAGTFVGGLAKLAGDTADALTGRSSSAARTVAARPSSSSMMPLLLLGGGVVLLLMMSKK